MGAPSSLLLPERTIKLKVCLVGEAACGKTSLVRRFVHDRFDDRYIATLGTKVTMKDLRMEVDGQEERVALLIWDIMGDRGIRDLLRESFFFHTRGALLVADATRPETLEALAGWREAIEAVAGPVPAYVLANKVDLKEEARVTAQDLEAASRRWGAPCRMTSAKTGENVEEAFEGLARLIVEDGGEEQRGATSLSSSRGFATVERFDV